MMGFWEFLFVVIMTIIGIVLITLFGWIVILFHLLFGHGDPEDVAGIYKLYAIELGIIVILFALVQLIANWKRIFYAIELAGRGILYIFIPHPQGKSIRQAIKKDESIGTKLPKPKLPKGWFSAFAAPIQTHKARKLREKLERDTEWQEEQTEVLKAAINRERAQARKEAYKEEARREKKR